MTTDQTIDGVPRELIEDVLAIATTHATTHWSVGVRDRLRALLDREVITDDHLRQRIAFLTSEVHARANERDAALSQLAELKAAQPQGATSEVVAFGIQVEKLLCDALGREWSASGMSIESLVAELKGKAQGESVAWYKPHWNGKSAEWCLGAKLTGAVFPEMWKPLYAEQPAPVAVVLAEARTWLGDGLNSDGLAQEYWTPEYAALIERIDATLRSTK